MPTLFSRILAGELPARFVWQDAEVAAFLSIAPLTPGHTLVVPRREVDQWTDAEGDLLARCVTVAQAIGRGVRRAWDAPRAGLVIAGFEVPHLHIHVAPAWGMAELDFSRARIEKDEAALDDAAARLRTALRELGFTEQVAAGG
ncbi:MAG: HIT family protein [Streptomyces sp.]|jgi:diadenosine tetraphosphate (Ap4A) HIT family hydrolase|uniref:HIT family protein n=1 Tax=Streptomyces sp. TaxID=1931 RepID=UPI0025E7237F|nr:HIT family protein [Streptomyces sp.]MBW8800232.1 HIT family protein [Streptomyces sp.]